MAARLVEQVMEREPVFVHPEDDVRRAVELLREHELPGVPVIDDDRRVVGIVTESDLVIREPDIELRLPHFLDVMGGIVFIERFKGFEERIRKAYATRVADVMTPDPVTCGADESIRQAARKIVERHHNRLPVVGEDGRLVGMITRVHIVAALAEEE